MVNPSLVSALLADLVRIPSPNPPGDTHAIAAYLAERLAAHRPAKVAPPQKPDAPSVIARIGTGSPVIMLHAHIDTVPVAEDEAKHWRVDPYSAAVIDNRLYGKGSIDDKAPLAAMLHVFELAAQRADALRGSLVLCAAAEEEVGGQLGTRWLAENGHLPSSDFIVVGEQTANRAATASKGVLRATVRATGRSVHATNPDRGVNAIAAMSRAVLALEQYHHELSKRTHPLAGNPTCNVGVIRGGSTANAVPDSCTAYLDRRLIPGEDPEAAKAELRAVIEAVNVAPATLSVGEFLVSMPFESKLESGLGQAFLAAVASEVGDPGPVGYLPGSDAKHLLGLMRGEMVIFGPGSYEVAHAFDEYTDLGDLAQTARILWRFVEGVLF